MKVAGTFNGTGAALYLGIGFVPDFVRVINLEDGDLAELYWSRMMRSAEQVAGRRYVGSSGVLQIAALTVGTGISEYLGGTQITSLSTAYLVADPAKDKRAAGTGDVINLFTLQTPASKTGKFNAGVNTSYVGEGSELVIAGKRYVITALSNDGDADNEVTLNKAAPTGEVEFLGGMYDFVGASAGIVVPAGFAIDATSVINVSGEMCMFEAGTYDG